MTTQDILILLKYLSKSIVPPNEQDPFLTAVARLESLLHKESKAA